LLQCYACLNRLRLRFQGIAATGAEIRAYASPTNNNLHIQTQTSPPLPYALI